MGWLSTAWQEAEQQAQSCGFRATMAEFEGTYKGVKVTFHAKVYATVYIETPKGDFFSTDELPLELGHEEPTGGRLVLRLLDLSPLDEIFTEAYYRGLFVAEANYRRAKQHDNQGPREIGRTHLQLDAGPRPAEHDGGGCDAGREDPGR